MYNCNKKLKEKIVRPDSPSIVIPPKTPIGNITNQFEKNKDSKGFEWRLL